MLFCFAETSECQGPNCPPEGGAVPGAANNVAMPAIFTMLVIAMATQLL